MGGSASGGSYFSGDVPNLVNKLRESEKASSSAEYETAVNAVLGNMLASYNDRDRDTLSRHLATIKKALETDIEGTVDLLYGGSVAKHTYVDGFSDIDSLVVLDQAALTDRSPRAAKEFLANRLRKRYPEHEIRVGNVAVTVHFAGFEVQLIPAMRAEGRTWVPNENGRWARINPEGFTKALTTSNKTHQGKIIPAVKLAKGIVAGYPDSMRPTGYHLEALAVEAFKSYSGPHTLKDMVSHLFERSAQLVRQPITDRTGQSIHVDSYLGSPDSIDRRVLSAALDRTARRMRNADRAESPSEWNKLLQRPDK